MPILYLDKMLNQTQFKFGWKIFSPSWEVWPEKKNYLREKLKNFPSEVYI